jgi:hypothetical protein
MLQLRSHAKRTIFDQGKMLKSQSGFVEEITGTIRILVGFLQVFSSFGSTMAIPWPQAMKDMMRITNAINIDLSDIFSTFKVCNFVTSFENTFITFMLFLPAIFLIATIAAIVLSIFDRKFKTTYGKGITKISLTAMFLLYPSIGGKIFSVFQCHNVGKKRFFVPHMAYECHTGEHLGLVTLSIIGIFVYVLGIPIYTVFILRKNKKHLYGEGPEHDRVLQLYGSLYSQYKPEYWYWEVVEMLRKVFLCGGLIAIASGTSFQIVVALLVQFAYLLVIERTMPYKAVQDDVVQFIGSVQLFLTLLAGLILNLQAGTKNAMEPGETSNFGSLLVALNTSIFLSMVFSIYISTASGKKCFDKLIKKKQKSKKVENVTQIVPVENITEESVKDDENEAEIVQGNLVEIRQKYGAGSNEYKEALQNINVKNIK